MAPACELTRHHDAPDPSCLRRRQPALRVFNDQALLPPATTALNRQEVWLGMRLTVLIITGGEYEMKVLQEARPLMDEGKVVGPGTSTIPIT